MIVLQQVQHTYDRDPVVEVPELQVEQGEHRLIVGLSGSGKTTLLHIMAGLLEPTDGRVIIAGQNLADLSGSARDRFRGRTIGVVFQQLHLLPTLTVEENLLMAPYMAGLEQDPNRARSVLADLDMEHKHAAYPDELSHGQKQRVALARAVMNRPRIILADEPTSNLDDVRSEQVITLLKRQAAEYDATLVLATHDRRLIEQFERRHTIENGRLEEAADANWTSADPSPSDVSAAS